MFSLTILLRIMGTYLGETLILSFTITNTLLEFPSQFYEDNNNNKKL